MTKLKQFRTDLKLSVTYVAKQTGIPEEIIKEAEEGKDVLGVREIMTLSSLYGVESDKLQRKIVRPVRNDRSILKTLGHLSARDSEAALALDRFRKVQRKVTGGDKC